MSELLNELNGRYRQIKAAEWCALRDEFWALESERDEWKRVYEGVQQLYINLIQERDALKAELEWLQEVKKKYESAPWPEEVKNYIEHSDPKWVNENLRFHSAKDQAEISKLKADHDIAIKKFWEEVDRSRSRAAKYRDSLSMTLPMAKGYAHANPVGANQAFCDQAEELLREEKA